MYNIFVNYERDFDEPIRRCSSERLRMLALLILEGGWEVDFVVLRQRNITEGLTVFGGIKESSSVNE